MVDALKQIDSILPNVFIEKITLETKGEIKNEQNPDINHQRIPNMVINPSTGKVEWETPDAKFDSDKTKRTKSMSIRIDLMIIEKIDNKILERWSLVCED